MAVPLRLRRARLEREVQEDPYVGQLRGDITKILEEHGASTRADVKDILAQAESSFLHLKREHSTSRALHGMRSFVGQVSENNTFNCIARERRATLCAALDKMLGERESAARIKEETQRLLENLEEKKDDGE